MAIVEISSAALGIAVISLIGRSVLSCLPPGELGSHRTAELPVTWAASYLLGCIGIAAAAALAVLAGLRFSCAWIAGAGALIAVARWLTLPGRLVPRHGVFAEPPSPVARAAFALALGIAVFTCWRMEISTQTDLWAQRAQALLSQGSFAAFDQPGKGALVAPPLESASIAFLAWPMGAVNTFAARAHVLASMVAALLLAERAMAIARRAPLGRRALLVPLSLALAAAATAEDGDVTSAAILALGLCGLIAWTRRADARGLALACLSSCALPLVAFDGWVLGFAGLCAVLAGTARPSLKRALFWTLGSAAALMAAWPLAAWIRKVPLFSAEPLDALASNWAFGNEGSLALWIAPVWIAFGAAVGPGLLRVLRGPRPGLEPSDPDLPHRDLTALFLLALLVFLGALLLIVLCSPSAVLLAKTWGPGLLVQSAPLAAVIAARVFVPAERTA